MNKMAIALVGFEPCASKCSVLFNDMATQSASQTHVDTVNQYGPMKLPMDAHASA